MLLKEKIWPRIVTIVNTFSFFLPIFDLEYYYSNTSCNDFVMDFFCVPGV